MDFDSTSLTRLTRAQDRQKDGLVDRYAPLVHYWCRRSELSEEDAANVFQDVFCVVAESIGDFHRDSRQGSFRGWLRTITANKIRDHFRRRSGNLDAVGATASPAAGRWVPDLRERKVAMQASCEEWELNQVVGLRRRVAEGLDAAGG